VIMSLIEIIRFIIKRETNILCGQNNSGMWYCKELPANSTKEMDKQINEMNRILNKYNMKKDGEK